MEIGKQNEFDLDTFGLCPEGKSFTGHRKQSVGKGRLILLYSYIKKFPLEMLLSSLYPSSVKLSRYFVRLNGLYKKREERHL